MLHYKLDGKLPVPVDMMEWAVWFGTADRKVAHTDLPEGFWVSTIFLGIDHGFGSETPLLFETMVFSHDSGEDVNVADAEGEYMELFGRYSNWNDAERGHTEIVTRMEQWILSLTNQKIHPTWASLLTNRGDI